jgi:hypothetical protein
VIRTIGRLTIRAGMRSVGVRRTTLGYNTSVQYRVGVRNRQSECARCQDGKTKAKNNV